MMTAFGFIERTALFAVVAFAVSMIGGGRWSLDNALDIEFAGWWGAAIAGVLGVGGALGQLALSYRPKAST